MSAREPLGTVVPMSQHGESPDSLESARQALAGRDADLAAADGDLAEALAGAHALAVESISRIKAINAELEAVTTNAPKDSPAGAHELGRHLVAKTRDIAAVVSETKAAVHVKAIALRELTDRYR